MIAGRPSRLRLVSLAVLGVVLAYVVVLPPHLVHHAFEFADHHDHEEPPCPHLALSQQTTELPSDSPDVVIVSAVPAIEFIPAVVEAPPAPEHGAATPRGPPFA